MISTLKQCNFLSKNVAHVRTCTFARWFHHIDYGTIRGQRIACAISPNMVLTNTVGKASGTAANLLSAAVLPTATT